MVVGGQGKYVINTVESLRIYYLSISTCFVQTVQKAEKRVATAPNHLAVTDMTDQPDLHVDPIW